MKIKIILFVLVVFIIGFLIQDHETKEIVGIDTLEIIDTRIDTIYKIADSLVGTPYCIMDCSKFVKTCYASVGAYLPRVSTNQYYYSMTVRDSLYKNLLFFDTGWTARKPNHVGIQKDSAMYHSVSQGVILKKINDYWKLKFYPKKDINFRFYANL